MKIGRPFNTFGFNEYVEIIPQHKSYTDFNTLGLYRSILENEKLSLDQKFEVLEISNKHFQKTFDFLVLKDPSTWFNLTHLGKDLTFRQEWDLWKEVQEKQELILKSKRIKHRNFGIYAKHDCGVPHCPYDGLMVHPNSPLSENQIHFKSDENKWAKKEQSKKRKRFRKQAKKIINDDLDLN